MSAREAVENGNLASEYIGALRRKKNKKYGKGG